MDGRRRLLASPRFRRRLGWSGATLGIAGGIAALVVLYPATRPQPERFSNEPAKVLAKPVPVALSAADRRAALETADRFLATAVAREDVARSFDLVHPSLREGFTRGDWARGDIPIVPFPVDFAKYKFDYAYRDLVGWRVSVYPKPRSGFEPMVFYLDLTAAGKGAKRRWLVSNWSPGSTSAGAAVPGSSGGGTMAIDGPLAQQQAESRLGAAWLLVPVGLLAAGIGAIGLFFLRDWRRTARVEREWRAS